MRNHRFKVRCAPRRPPLRYATQGESLEQRLMLSVAPLESEQQSAAMFTDQSINGQSTNLANLAPVAKNEEYLVSSSSFSAGHGAIPATHVYFVAGGVLKRANLDGSQLQTLAWSGPSIKRLEVDIVNQKLYATTSNGIWRSDLNGAGAQQIVASTDEIRALVIDSPGDRLFWTAVVGSAGKIMRSKLDGSAQTAIVNNISDVRGLTFDPGQQELYWSQEGYKAIARAKPDGSQSMLFGEFYFNAVNSLDFDVIGRRLYTSGFGISSKEVDITKDNPAYGDSPLSVVSLLFSVNGPDFAVDTAHRDIFWIDPTSGTLDRSALNGTQKTVVAQGNISAVALDQATGVELNYGVLANDSDPEAALLTASLDSNVTHGSLQLSANGSFNYTPTPGFSGIDRFSYRVSDGVNETVGTVSLLVGVNYDYDYPAPQTDFYSTPAGAALSVNAAAGLLSNDSDPIGASLSVIRLTEFHPQHGTIDVHEDGSFVYTPAAGFVGTETFTYYASNARSARPGQFAITVGSTGTPPQASDDTYYFGLISPMEKSAKFGVLANDSDADHDTLTALIVTQPADGHIDLNSDGSFSLSNSNKPQALLTFTYRAFDGKNFSNLATVTLSKSVYNPAPWRDSYNATQNTTLVVPTALGLLANEDTGPDWFATLGSPPVHGSITIEPRGGFTYVPNQGFFGDDDFSYFLDDNLGHPVEAFVHLHVERSVHPPIAVNDVFAAKINTTLTSPDKGVIYNDVDQDHDPLTAELVSTTQHGVLTFNTDGTFVYQPAANYTGVDTFSYRTTDGVFTSGIATASILINLQQQVVEDLQFSLASNGYSSRAMAVANDAAGNLYVTGEFQGTVDFDPDPVAVYQLTSHGATGDAFVVKYSHDGAFLWAQVGAAYFDQVGAALDIDDAGNVYVAGDYFGFPQFPNDNSPALQVSNMGNAFLWKLNGQGTTQWVRGVYQFPDENGQSVAQAHARSVAVDHATGAVVMVGEFFGKIGLGPGSVPTFLETVDGIQDSYIWKLDANGTPLWSRQLRGDRLTHSFGVDIDAQGNIYTTGRFAGSTDFDPSLTQSNVLTTARPTPVSGPTNSNMDVFVQKLRSDGSFVWVRSFSDVSSGEYDSGNSIAVAASGVYIAGQYTGDTDFDPSPTSTRLLTGGGAFVAKLTLDGGYVWARSTSQGTGDGAAHALSLDPAGNIFVTGSFTGLNDFDNQGSHFLMASQYYTPENYSSSDLFLWKLSASGEYLGVLTAGGAGTDDGWSVATDANGLAYVVGMLTPTVDSSSSLTSLQAGSLIVADRSGQQSLATSGSAIFIGRYDLRPALSVPPELNLSAASIAENSLVGAVVGTLSLSGPSAALYTTLTLPDSAGGRFQVVGSQIVVANGTLLNYEVATSHTVVARAQTAGGLFVEKQFTITVTNVNERPTAITLVGGAVAEHSAEHTIVGDISVEDPDQNDTQQLVLIDNAGGRFALENKKLVVANHRLLDYETATSFSVTVRTTDSGGLSLDRPLLVNLTDIDDVRGRFTFYNNSIFDQSNAGQNAADDAAIATKTALQPGQDATLANYTNYSRGINGILVDIAGLRGVPTTADFDFEISNGQSPLAWTAAPAPLAISVRSDAGANGSDRVDITWPDGAISNVWLRVTVKPTAATGLGAADVFYFGNVIGESGDDPAHAVVNASDEIGARNNLASFLSPAGIGNAYDFNRDGLVNAADQIIARGSITSIGAELGLLKASSFGQPGLSPALVDSTFAQSVATALAVTQSARSESDLDSLILSVQAPAVSILGSSQADDLDNAAAQVLASSSEGRNDNFVQTSRGNHDQLFDSLHDDESLFVF